VGDRVHLLGEALTDAGNVVLEGQVGVVVGFKGFGEAVVTWTTGHVQGETSCLVSQLLQRDARPVPRR
jgi:hypothetical protein